MFKDQQKLYADEGIEQKEVLFEDNHPILEVMELQKNSLLNLLDETS